MSSFSITTADFKVNTGLSGPTKGPASVGLFLCHLKIAGIARMILVRQDM